MNSRQVIQQQDATKSQLNQVQRHQPRAVLSEEDYSETLSKVIQRNYFPNLPQLQAQVAIQNAREGQDYGAVFATRRAARRLQQHEETVLEKEEEQEQQQTKHGLRKVPRPLEHESLTNFHLRVTSQDNAEFDSVQKEEQQQREQQRQSQTKQAMALLISDKPSRATSGELTPLMLASDRYDPSPHRHVLTREETEQSSQTNNSLFFVPSATLDIDTDDGNHAGSDTKNEQGSELALMPPPPRTQSTSSLAITSKTNAALLSSVPVEYIPKDRFQKRIVPSATRFPQAVAVLPRTPQKQQSLEDEMEDSDASSMTEYTTDGSVTDLDESPRHSLQVERKRAIKRQKRERESFVAMTPVILPGQERRSAAEKDYEHDEEDDDEEPIVTWGEVSGTPLILPQKDLKGGPSFAMAQESSKDVAAQQAWTSLQKRGHRVASASFLRKPVESKQTSKQPRPLASKAMKPSLPPARSSSAFGSALRASYARPSSDRSINSSSRRPRTNSRLRPSMQDHRTAHASTPKLLQRTDANPFHETVHLWVFQEKEGE